MTPERVRLRSADPSQEPSSSSRAPLEPSSSTAAADSFKEEIRQELVGVIEKALSAL